MKLAVVSVTSQGAELGQRLAGKFPSDYEYAIYEKAGRESKQANIKANCYDDLNPLLHKIWQEYDAYVFIMAVGIVVRDIAKLIKHKSVDPAVVVMDELGLNCISLLSGHIGGANDLAKEVAWLAGANPVITTASDINGMVVPDAVSEHLNLAIESYTMLKRVNGCIVAKEKVDFYVDADLPEAQEFIAKAKTYGLDFSLWHDGVNLSESKGIVFVSENVAREIPFAQVLYLRPRNIVAGIGCRRGIEEAALMKALAEALAQSGYSQKGLRALVSAWVKQDEEGLLGLAKRLNIPIYFYEQEKLREVIEANGLKESDFVKSEIGVGNVCEAAALAYSRDAVMMKNKQSYAHITVALARVNFLL